MAEDKKFIDETGLETVFDIMNERDKEVLRQAGIQIGSVMGSVSTHSSQISTHSSQISTLQTAVSNQSGEIEKSTNLPEACAFDRVFSISLGNTLQQSGAAPGGEVVWCAQDKIFAYYNNNKYYGALPDNELYGTPKNGGGVLPAVGRIYLCKADSSFVTFDSEYNMIVLYTPPTAMTEAKIREIASNFGLNTD